MVLETVRMVMFFCIPWWVELTQAELKSENNYWALYEDRTLSKSCRNMF